jgi:hypothetical protein
VHSTIHLLPALCDICSRALERRGDQRLHGTTHERPIDRFAHEQLTPLGIRPLYRYERVQTSRVANDALVTIGAARYSVPGRVRRPDRQRAGEHY